MKNYIFIVIANSDFKTIEKQHFRPRPLQDPQDRTKTAQDYPKIAPGPFRDRPKTA